jgi:hypothetical protein
MQNLLSILDDLLNWMNTIDFGRYGPYYGMGWLPGLDYGPFGEFFLSDH